MPKKDAMFTEVFDNLRNSVHSTEQWKDVASC